LNFVLRRVRAATALNGGSFRLTDRIAAIGVALGALGAFERVAYAVE
jgi:hypothetical protein